MIEFSRVTFAYGETPVVADFSVKLRAGGHYALLGASGCGKTTLLSLAGGLIKPTGGTVIRAPGLRIGICFQEDRLLPWRTVLENVALACPQKARAERSAAALKLLHRVGLADQAASYPDALSGGMKRRAALARALAFPCDALLLDEPFRALDEAAHARMRELVLSHCKDKLLLLVTHDARDAQGMEILRV